LAITRGESAIANILDSCNIDSIFQAAFNSCRNKRPLPFDFFIPGLKLLIEYQGEGHFRPAHGGYPGLVRTQHHDAIKGLWARQNGYELIYINYWEYERIAEILATRLGDYAPVKIRKQLELF